MVEADVSDETGFWCDNIGGVQSSSQTNFNYRNIYFLFGKIIQGKSNCPFEKTGFNVLKSLPVFYYEFCHFAFWDHLTVDLNAFSKIDQVR